MSTPSVVENELLYRQVPPGGNPIYFAPSQKRPVYRAVFYPTQKDTDGLSVIRSKFRSQVWSAYRIEQPHVRFRLACLPNQHLRRIAGDCGIQTLSYLPTPDELDNQHGVPWAHCVITEINRTDYDSDTTAKKRIKEWALGVADLLGETDVVGPFEKPGEHDHYRPASGP